MMKIILIYFNVSQPQEGLKFSKGELEATIINDKNNIENITILDSILTAKDVS